MNEWTIVVIVALGVFAGAALGTYLAWQPAVESAKSSVEETAQQAQQTLQTAEESIQRAGENLANLEIHVPEPQVVINFHWWYIFSVTFAVVLGMAIVRMYDRSALRKIIERSLQRSLSWRRKRSRKTQH